MLYNALKGPDKKIKILESFTYNPYVVVTKMQDKRKDLNLFKSSIDLISNIKIYAKQC